jgi:hypothetical protein
MKTIKLVALLFIAAAACFLLGGCSALDKLYDKQVQEVPGEVLSQETTYRTNTVVIEAEHTDDNGTFVPARVVQTVVPEVVTRYAPATYVTNLVTRPSVATGIQLTGAVPAPWASAVALGLGWLYSAYASVRNKQVAKALVQSVQVGREFLQSTPEGQKIDAELKAKLQRHQQYLGVADLVKQLLNKYVPDHTQAKA